MLDIGAESREELTANKTELEAEIKVLQKQLAAYSDTDPTELERKKKDIERFKAEAEQWTDDIYTIERWFKKMVQDDEALKGLRMSMYGDELDEEEGILKELT